VSAAPSGLASPPPADRLAGFPSRPAPARLHRLSEYPDVWWYASRPGANAPGGGRFDLVLPEGTCYLAAALEGALLEKTLRRPKRIVPLDRLVELFHAEVRVTARVPLADLAAEAATGYGLNAEIHTTLDYRTPNAWARALRRAGARGLRYLLRADNALEHAGVALFGRAGRHRRAPAGMRTAVAPLDVEAAVTLLEERGVRVVPIPPDVPTVAPPP
jgi:hypothetical protein